MPSSSVSTDTPSQPVPSLDHDVTQWMSTVIDSFGSAWNSSQLQLRGSSTEPVIENSHSSSGTSGVGPAESTGKPSVRYCPGGSSTPGGASGCRRRKPRVKEGMGVSLAYGGGGVAPPPPAGWRRP